MNTNRDSFDVRIDDDLFEFIVSYLPIEDKLRYESVSKRFQRFVFNKQKVLKITCYEDSVHNLNEDILVDDYNSLKTLLKKFQFIDTLEIDFFLGKVLDTITESCNRLKAIKIDVHNIDLEALKNFCRKFGQQLRQISFSGNRINEQVFKDVFKCLTNVSSISNIPVHYLSSELILEKLVKLDTTFVGRYPELSDSSFDQLFNLKYLSIHFKREQDYSLIEEFFKYLKNLKVFKLRAFSQSMNKTNNWSKTIESIATNCRQLEYFSLHFFHFYYQSFYEKQCFQSFAHFSGLRKLSFKTSDNSYQQINKQITNLSPLKKCKNLLNLKLELFSIKSNIFSGIELIVPQLRQLCLKCANLEIRDEVLEAIARLKYLMQIQLMSDRIKMSADGLRVLINGCKRLKHFYVRYSVPVKRINKIRINEVIERHPNIHFDFKRKGYEYNFEDKY